MTGGAGSVHREGSWRFAPGLHAFAGGVGIPPARPHLFAYEHATRLRPPLAGAAIRQQAPRVLRR